MTKAEANAAAADLEKRGIENALVLRGDLPAGESVFRADGYAYAKDFIAEIKKSSPSLCIGAAAYPEGHITKSNQDVDIGYLKQKQDAGADFFITQLFFENACFYRFLERARKKGVTAPISAGVMPILSRAQIERMIFMCGASLPAPIIKLFNKYGGEGDGLLRAGVEYAAAQAEDLAKEGADGVHLYTMNKPFIAQTVTGGLKLHAGRL
jgi:methylenetetrahydrofolate reductase (NADPH)